MSVIAGHTSHHFEKILHLKQELILFYNTEDVSQNLRLHFSNLMHNSQKKTADARSHDLSLLQTLAR